MQYRLLVDLKIVQILGSFPKKVRTRLLDHFQKIQFAPDDFSDYHERDPSGRRVEISIMGNHAIHYWIDHADLHIKILALKPAD